MSKKNTKASILIIDDDLVSLKFVSELLTENNYTIFPASDWRTAKETAVNHNIELILLDVVMPEINGFDLCSHFKKNDITKNIPIIFLTCLTDKVHIVKGFRSGAVDYVLKPYNSDELLKRIETQVEIVQARKKIQQREQWYSQLFYDSPVILLTINDEERITDVNSEYIHFTGFTREESIGKEITNIICKNIEFPNDEIDIACGKNGRQCQMIKKNGEIADVVVKCQLFHDINNQQVRLVSVNDVSRLVTNEKSLQQQINFTETILNTIPNPVFFKDKNGNYVKFNRAFADEIIGLPKEKIIHRKIEDFKEEIPDHLKKIYLEKDKKLLKEREKQVYEGKVKKANGEIGDFLFNKACYYNNKEQPDGIVGIMTDISERKSMLKKIQESNQRYKDLATMLPLTVFEAEATGKIIFVNNAGLEAFGYSKYDLKKGLYIQDILEPSQHQVFIERLQKTLQGMPLKDIEYTFITKNNKSFVGRVYYKIEKDAKGKILIRGIVNDVSVQRSIEEKTKRVNRELKRINDAKDKFLSMLAHDLKNPFTSIMGFSEMLVNKLKNPDPDMEKLEMYAETIMETCMQGQNLINNVEGWSRSKLKPYKAHPKSWPVARQVKSNSLLYASSANKKNVNIVIDVPDNLTAWADKNMMDTVVRNLISNSIKFSYPSSDVYIQASRENDSVILTVEDKGVGMSKEQQDKLFEADDYTSTRGTEQEKGSGIGMMLCKLYLKENKGGISVESAPGKGSIFRVKIPARNDEQ